MCKAVSVAIENAQLYKQTQYRLSEVFTLYTLAKQVTSSLELNTVLDSIVNALKLSINCRACSLFLLDEGSQAQNGPGRCWQGSGGGEGPLYP
jgi:GAF domain-containing protein